MHLHPVLRLQSVSTSLLPEGLVILYTTVTLLATPSDMQQQLQQHTRAAHTIANTYSSPHSTMSHEQVAPQHAT